MSAEDVVAIVTRLQGAGLPVWLDGGWRVDAIVVADALCWEEEAPAELADAVGRQYLLRALIYRAVTSLEFGGDAARELEVAFALAA